MLRTSFLLFFIVFISLRIADSYAQPLYIQTFNDGFALDSSKVGLSLFPEEYRLQESFYAIQSINTGRLSLLNDYVSASALGSVPNPERLVWDAKMATCQGLGFNQSQCINGGELGEWGFTAEKPAETIRNPLWTTWKSAYDSCKRVLTDSQCDKLANGTLAKIRYISGYEEKCVTIIGHRECVLDLFKPKYSDYTLDKEPKKDIDNPDYALYDACIKGTAALGAANCEFTVSETTPGLGTAPSENLDFGVDAKIGAELAVEVTGETGIQGELHVSGGEASASINGSIETELTVLNAERGAFVANELAITSSLSAEYALEAPTLNAQLDAVFDMGVDLDGNLCVLDCFSLDLPAFTNPFGNFNLLDFTLSPELDLNLFGLDVEDFDGGKPSAKVDVYFPSGGGQTVVLNNKVPVSDTPAFTAEVLNPFKTSSLDGLTVTTPMLSTEFSLTRIGEQLAGSPGALRREFSHPKINDLKGAYTLANVTAGMLGSLQSTFSPSVTLKQKLTFDQDVYADQGGVLMNRGSELMVDVMNDSSQVLFSHNSNILDIAKREYFLDIDLGVDFDALFEPILGIKAGCAQLVDLPKIGGVEIPKGIADKLKKERCARDDTYVLTDPLLSLNLFDDVLSETIGLAQFNNTELRSRSVTAPSSIGLFLLSGFGFIICRRRKLL